MPTISIITPSFNQASYLVRCLASVGSQSRAPVQHIILDPGSSDGSRQIAEDYSSRHGFVSTVFEPDDGQVDAINRGFRRAEGEILTWLNSDDAYCSPDALATVSAKFDEHPEADVVFGRGYYVDESGQRIKDAYVRRPDDEMRMHFEKSIGILQPALFFRRSLLDRVGDLDPRYNLSLDYDYWIRLAEADARFVFVDEALALATMHSDSKTMGSRSAQLDEILDLQVRHFGRPHQDWIRRAATHRATGEGGITDNPDERTYGELARIRYHERQIRREFDPKGPPRTAVLATTFDRHYFEQGLSLIAGVHRTSLGSVSQIVIYDLGLTDQQRGSLEGLAKTTVVAYPEETGSLFDGYMDPKNYSYKCAAIRDAGQFAGEGEVVLWLDAGVAPMRAIDEIIETTAEEGVFFVNHDDIASWPFYNIQATHIECLEAMGATLQEALGPHLCSCVVGYVKGGPYASLIDEAYEWSKLKEVVVWPKHLEPEDLIRQPVGEAFDRSRSLALLGDSKVASSLHELRDLFGYWGHRQDQSIYSVLCARYGAKQHSARRYNQSNQPSRTASKENWQSGSVSPNLEPSYSQVDGTTQSTVIYHHRGIYSNLDGLESDARSSDCLFVIGNGPSLQDFDFDRLTGHDTIGMNVAYRHWHRIGWYPTYYTCLDSVVAESHADAIADLVVNAEDYGIEGFLLRESVLETHPEIEMSPRVRFLERERNRHRIMDTDSVTTGSHSMLWGVSLGYTRIFLLGIDLTYEEVIPEAQEDEAGALVVRDVVVENPNYFFDDYQQPGDRYNFPNPHPGLHDRSWANAAALLPPAVDVLNLNPDSALELFPFGETARALRESDLSHRSIVRTWRVHGGAAEQASVYGPFESETFGTDAISLVGALMKLRNTTSGTLLDIRSNDGRAAEPFLQLGWAVQELEPDTTGQWIVERDWHDIPASTKSSDVKVLSTVLEQRGISHVDVLVIDCGDVPLPVLEQFPWQSDRPEVVVCRFDDQSTMPSGYQADDLVAVLQLWGYDVWAQEIESSDGQAGEVTTITSWHPDIVSGERGGYLLALRPGDGMVESLGRLLREMAGSSIDSADDGRSASKGKSEVPDASMRPRRPEGGTQTVRRPTRALRKLIRWYATPSGLMFGLAIALAASALAFPAWSRWLALAALGVLGLFIPYRLSREQRRNDERLRSSEIKSDRRTQDQLQEERVRVDNSVSALHESVKRSADELRVLNMSAQAGVDEVRLAVAKTDVELRRIDSSREADQQGVQRLRDALKLERSQRVESFSHAVHQLVSSWSDAWVADDRDEIPPRETPHGPDVLKGKSLIFCASSGRVGTHYLAELLGSCDRVFAVHEAPPYMIGSHLKRVLREPLSDSYEQRRVKAAALRATLAGLPRGSVYAETNHMFVKTFHDVVINEFPPGSIQVVVLRRSLDRVLKSLLELGYFTGADTDWPLWMYVPEGAALLARPPRPIQQLDDVDRAIGYLFDIEARLQQFRTAYPGIKTVQAQLEEIQTEEGAAKLLRELGLQPSPATSAVIGKPTNERTTSRVTEVDIDECRFRIRTYHSLCREAGVWAPDLDSLLLDQRDS